MDASRETPDLTTKPTCYDLTYILQQHTCIRNGRADKSRATPRSGHPGAGRRGQRGDPASQANFHYYYHYYYYYYYYYELLVACIFIVSQASRAAAADPRRKSIRISEGLTQADSYFWLKSIWISPGRIGFPQANLDSGVFVRWILRAWTGRGQTQEQGSKCRAWGVQRCTI